MARIYLITGAAGHLGSTLVRLLLERGEKVRALVLPGDSTAKSLPEQVMQVVGDVTDPASLEPFFSNPNGDEMIVIHAAGIVTIASKYDALVDKVNVGGTRNITDACIKHQVQKLIYVSSVHAIAEKPMGETITETQDFSDHKVIGLYAKTKAQATAYVLQKAREGLNACVVHPSGIAGPYDRGHGYIDQLLVDYCKGTLVAGVQGGYDFVDVRDVAQGILNCVEKGRSGEGYLLTNRYFTVRELLDVFCEVTGCKPVKVILPMWLAKSTAGLSELYYKLRRQPPLYTRYSMYTLSSNAIFSHEKADRELGYTTRQMSETVKDTHAWLKSIGRL